MAIAINRVTNANIYVNGNNLLGRAEQVTLPDVKMKFTDHKALGMIGTMEFPSGVEKLEAKIKWNSWYTDVWQQVSNPYNAVQLMVRCSVETYSAVGRISEQPLVTFLVGQFKNIPLGDYKQHENAEFESSMSVTACKQIINGVTVLEYDALSNIFRSNGVDLLAQYKINTGA